MQRGLTGEIINRFEKKGYKLVAMKLKQATRAEMETHYVSGRMRAALCVRSLEPPVFTLTRLSRAPPQLHTRSTPPFLIE